jgi:hypothetical protein
MPLKELLKSRLLLSEGKFNYTNMEDLPFWKYEYVITEVNEIIDAREKNRKTEENKQSQQMPKMNTSSITNNMSSIANKFKK